MKAGHGTYAGWNRHRREGTPICLDCREAARQYKAKWRQDNPEGYAREKAQTKAQHHALWRLAALYPVEFAALVAEEEVRLGRARIVRRTG